MGYHIFTGYVLNDRLAKVQFTLIFLGVNVTFFPQHFLGLQGMPRRYSDYPDQMTNWNVIRSSWRLLRIAGALFFAGVIWNSLSTNSSCEMERITVEFTPRFPASWHTFNETTLYF